MAERSLGRGKRPSARVDSAVSQPKPLAMVARCNSAADHHLPGAPIDVVQLDRGDLARASPESREQHEDR